MAAAPPGAKRPPRVSVLPVVLAIASPQEVADGALAARHRLVPSPRRARAEGKPAPKPRKIANQAGPRPPPPQCRRRPHWRDGHAGYSHRHFAREYALQRGADIGQHLLRMGALERERRALAAERETARMVYVARCCSRTSTAGAGAGGAGAGAGASTLHADAMRAYVERSVTPRFRDLMADVDADERERSRQSRSALSGWGGGAGTTTRPNTAVGRLATTVAGFERTARCHTAR